MGQDDTNTPNSSSGEQEYAEDTENRPEQPGSPPVTTGGEGDDGEEPRVPYSRFRQVNEAAKHFQRQAAAANAELERQKAAAQKPQSDVEYTPEQLEQVRRVMRLSDAQYRDMVEERERQQQERAQFEEDLLDDTHDEIVKLAKGNGLPVGNEEFMTIIGQSVMLTIKNDRKLYRQWNNGDLSCVGPAFDKLKSAIISPVKGAKNGASQGNVARIKRQVANLPTAPSGGAGTVTAFPAKPKDEKGITKSTHDRAWALLQSQSE